MLRGCISLGDVHCDSCKRAVRYLERYLVTEEEGKETLRLCEVCASERGLVHYRHEKGERLMTIFPREDSSGPSQ